MQPFFDVAPANEYLVMMMMFTENAVWQCAVSQQFDGAVEVSFQPFCGDACVRVVIQCLVDAGDGLHLLQHSADVVTDKDDGAFFVNFRQQFIESGFKTFVDIRAGFVKDQYRGSEMMARPSSARCSCPPLSCPMERCSSPSSPMRAMICLPFSLCSGVKREVRILDT